MAIREICDKHGDIESAKSTVEAVARVSGRKNRPTKIEFIPVYDDQAIFLDAQNSMRRDACARPSA